MKEDFNTVIKLRQYDRKRKIGKKLMLYHLNIIRTRVIKEDFYNK